MKYAIKHRAIKKYRKNKSANINCIVLSFAAFSICDFLSAWFEADPNQYNYTISEPVCQFINCITVMFFGTAKYKVNSRRLWSGRRKKWCRFCASHTTNPRNRDVKRFRGWRLFPLLSAKQTLTVLHLGILTWFALIWYRLSQFFEVFLLLLSNSYHEGAIICNIYLIVYYRILFL